MSGQVEFALLGPLLVRGGSGTLPALPAKQRVLLAALLLRANCRVSLDDLAKAVWGAETPATACGTLRGYVKDLRKAVARVAGPRISTVTGGYQIQVDDAELDVCRFELLRGSARAAAEGESWEQAAAQFRQALSLWRGEPLADVPSEWLAAREIPRLTELYLQTLESCAEAYLELGRHADVLADLRLMIAAHPLRERLHMLLMVALYRDGRQAEALAAYQHIREVLRDELGADPGPDLRELHQQVLSADPALAPPQIMRKRGAVALAGTAAGVRPSVRVPHLADFSGPALTPAADPAPGDPVPARSGSGTGSPLAGLRRQEATVVPRQLPATVRNFTGRAAELAMLAALLDHDPIAPRLVVISAIAGTAGVGKTALAVRWAHEVADRFPDGQLYVNLRGYDPGQPVQAAQALAGFLRALGVAGHDIPADTEERAALYRSMMAERRMLVLLDNAGSAEQVRLLLPGTPGSTVMVTSRDSLAGLVAMEGARRLHLDLLPLDDAVRLLQTLIGRRADADPPAVERLARQSARLPLALRVAAELIAARPAAALGALAVELADQRRRLDLLDAGGDARVAVRVVFSWSLQHLDSDAARAFRLLGLHPGTDFEAYALAALAALTLEQARSVLAALARANLVQPTGPNRHGMHDLLRAYAAEEALGHITEPERRAALDRLLDHYLQTAAIAVESLGLAEQPLAASLPPPPSPAPPVGDPAAARSWLDEQRPTLVEVAGYAASHGSPGHATRLASCLFRYLEGGGYYAEIAEICGHALQAARLANNLAAEAEALNNICLVDLRQGRLEQAAERLDQALSLHRQTGDLTGQARALGNLGIICFQHGSFQEAIQHQKPALALYRQASDLRGESRTLGNLGLIYLQCGEFHQANRYLQPALKLARQISLQSAEAQVLGNLGLVFLGQGRYQQAFSAIQQSLTLFRDMGDPAGEARALNCLGEVSLAAGEPRDARTQHAGALRLAVQIGDKEEEARAHDGLARAHQALSQTADARRHWERALALYTDLGAPDASRIRERLDD